jgi:uncharacterized protein YjbJ (UPF0337 family)
VTSPGQAAGAAQQAAGTTASTAKDEAAATASTATSAATEVAGTAKQQAGQVAGEAVNQARQLTDQAKAQASQQATNATQKLSESVRSLATEVRDMSQGTASGSGPVAGLAQQLADKGEQLAEYLSQQGPGGLVQELRMFAARRPGTFLLGALAAGVATGRVVKGATAGASGGMTGTGAQSSPAVAGVQPVAVAPAPVTSVPSTPAPSTTPISTGAPSRSGGVPVAMSDDSGVLDGDVQRVEGAPGTGLR